MLYTLYSGIGFFLLAAINLILAAILDSWQTPGAVLFIGFTVTAAILFLVALLLSSRNDLSQD